MSDPTPPPAQDQAPARGRGGARRTAGRIALWAGAAVGGLLLLLLAAVAALNTVPGRGFLVERINAFSTASGLSVRVGAINGSLYGRMTVRDLEVRDTQGVFLTAPAITLDWRPLAYLHRKVDVRQLAAPIVRLLRKPVLKPTPPKPAGPLLPNIDLTIGRLDIDQFSIAPAVTGQHHIVGVHGSADLRDGRARLDAALAALVASGVAGGDRLTVKLDAQPSANRLQIAADLDAPAGGLLDSYAHLGRPLSFRVDGRGDWRNWTGRATARLASASLADLVVTARDGTIRVAGPTQPGLLLTGQAVRMVEPALNVDLTAKLMDRKADTSLSLRSGAMAVAAQGLIDLGRNRFGDLRIQADLLKPGAIAPNLSGRDVRVAVVLDGPFARPRVDYDLSATAVGFGATTVEGLKASGRAQVDPRRTMIPIKATARRVTGLDASVGGLLTDLRIDGSLAFDGSRVLSDNLRLRSKGIDATAIIVADLKAGRYNAALKGRVQGYEVDGVGRFDLVTNAKLVSGRAGGFGIRGNVRVDTRRLDNAAVRDFLGGTAVLTADVGLDEAGVISVARLRLTAPQFRILDGAGSYRPDGRLTFRANAASTRYGPLALTASGTAQKPVVRLTASRPNVGMQLQDVVVDLTGEGGRYRIRGRGGSPYGPFAADVTIRPGDRLSIDVASASLAGIVVRGALAQTAAGPFAGDLALDGSGLSGTVRLSAEGAVQRADADLRAANARLPVQPAATIAAGSVTATALLYPNAPSVTGRLRLTGLRQGSLVIDAAQAQGTYRNGRGEVGLTAKGRSGAPFDVAARAAITPDLVRANLTGTVNGLALRLREPAQISKVGGGWRLAPMTLLLPQGEVQLTGQTGARTELHARLRNLDLSMTRTFQPSLQLAGKVSGVVDLTAQPGGAIPTASARLDISNFSRVGLATESIPVDIAVSATLGSRGADVNGLIRRGGANLGRLQARLGPPAGGSAAWTARLLEAPLSGGIRYSGPSEVLWALSGVAGQQLSGPIAIAADFGGRANRPNLTGVVRADALRYENPTYGTVISNIATRANFSSSRLQIVSLTGRAGRGSITASGSVGLDAEGGFPIDLKATLDQAQLARSNALAATVSGTIAVTNSRERGGVIEGDLRIPEARYQIVRQGAADVSDLTGVRRRNAPPPEPAGEKTGGLPSKWRLDIRVRADNRIYVSGMGLEAEWRTDLRVAGSADQPAITGRLDVVRGTYSFAGRRLEINRGQVAFQGGQITDPLLDISASTTAEGVSATINITGRAQNPQIAFTSTPALPQDEVLSRLLFGSSVGSLSPTQAIQLAAALNSLRGGGGGLNPLGKLRSTAGIDRLRVLGADAASGRGTAVAAGQYITNNIYVEIITDARGFTATQLEIALSRTLSILSQAGSFGGSNFSLRYSKDY